MRKLREELINNELFDLKYVGDKFTWSNKHSDGSFTKERLDRVLANSSWKTLFSEIIVESLLAICSDHKPVLLSASRTEWRVVFKVFRYEASWSNDEDCRKLIEKDWRKGLCYNQNLGERVMCALSHCSRALMKWSKTKKGEGDRSIKQKMD